MYTVDYYTNKFEAIPEEEWCVGALHYNGRSCALGHCGATFCAVTEKFNPEAQILRELFMVVGKSVAAVNDNDFGGYDYLGDTPKKRILNVLYEIKEKLDLEQTEESVKFVNKLLNEKQEKWQLQEA